MLLKDVLKLLLTTLKKYLSLLTLNSKPQTFIRGSPNLAP